MKIDVLTLFPEFMDRGLHTSILGRACNNGLLDVNIVNIRDFSDDKNGRVDDYTYGGGAGMLMQPQPVYDAYMSLKKDKKCRTIYVTPQGKPFTQKDAVSLSKEEELVFLCGHYEGIDERVLDEIVTDRFSIGDYVLTGGELPALVMIDAVSRLVPGVLGNDTSAEIESFYGDLLEYPQYTRPEVWRDKKVPEVLLTGNPKSVAEYRKAKAEELTKKVRPDLYEKYELRNKEIDRLLKDKRNNIQILESLRRGTGEIIHTDPLVVYMACDDLVMVDIDAVMDVDEFMALLPDNIHSIVVSKEFGAVLRNVPGMMYSCDVYNYVYTENVHRKIKNKDIRKLDESFADYVGNKYALGGYDYAVERLKAGVVYGIFVDDEIAGFVGTHGEGSIGMLYVDGKYRRRGLAADLEGFMFNRDLEAGRTPYGQVVLGNEASMKLQDKMGVYGGDKVLTWLHM
ncbi:MAG: tRNA (guanosine(37)-N1)-methyltransferase TrmD [Lachnospiraceae bacterium]|nr:tRNA (guanosine(37)-N1)-methyltransferase TrmD [Lachnospiraceae bacterium]